MTDMDSFCKYYLDKISDLDMLMSDLRDAHRDPLCAEELERVKNHVVEVQNQLIFLSSKIRESHQQLQRLQLLKQALCDQSGRMTHLYENRPPRLPTRQAESVKETRKPMTDISKATCNPVVAKATSNLVPEVTASQQGKQINVYVPEIELITTDEFETIPKYQKGRLAYDQVNKIIEGMNVAYRAKYKLFKMKRSTMSDANRKMFEKYKLQETKDTKDCYFIVDDDMKHYGGLKIDNNTRSILTILRHCGRIREVRGGRLTRYVYIDSY